MIDNTSCINAVNTIKTYVSNCFNKCTAKGSTFSGTQKLYNLEEAINLIPQTQSGGGTGGTGGSTSGNISGGSFGGFSITYDTSSESFTIDFGSVGVNWKSIVCYSDTKEGHFSINKISNSKCIISSAVFYNAENQWDEATGIFPQARGTYRANYSVSGNSITFTNNEYESTSNGMNTYDEFLSLADQVSDDVNDYFTDQYKLDKIIICV